MCRQKPITTVEKAAIYFPIVFTGKHSFNLKNKLSKLMKEFYPQISIKVIFKPALSIGNFFKHKDILPMELQSSVIYKYSCSCCNATYVGMTKRQLSVRISEHTGRSLRTNRPLSKPPFSAIREHSEDHDHPIQKNSFSILSSRAIASELSIAESLFIVKEKPTLCSHDRSTELPCF